jgi:lantibiotic leader peptide-processing serine protease
MLRGLRVSGRAGLPIDSSTKREEEMVRRLRRAALSVAAGLASVAAVAWGSAPPVAFASTGAADTYVVLYAAQAVPGDAAARVQAAGGSVVASYPEIGVVVARSAAASFTAQVRSDGRVSGVSATSGFASGIKQREPAAGEGPDVAQSPTLADKQWDMTQIRAFQAHQVTSGSRRVLVGDIDTGLDYTHPDLRSNVDFANSVSCIGGTPNQAPAAWLDDDGHGTHTAGTIAAAGGLTGVAPNVRIAAIKAGDANGFFFPEAVVCAFVWAGRHHMDVTNNSYFADPWLYNCLNDPGQRAIWEAETRAIHFAMGRGVTVVAAAGNENDDLGNPTFDNISPDFPPGAATTRAVDKNCFVIPAMVPGVYTVSAVGSLRLKSFYSSYGLPWTQAAAPGGDSRYQVTAAAPNGRVLSTYPASRISTLPPDRTLTVCGDRGCATYAYLQGTSMASPHVAGVAALIASRFGHQEPEEMRERLNRATDPLACPPAPFEPNELGPDGQPAHCSGPTRHNSFYGHGQIDALKAVTRSEDD